jgi:hypothetical protein
MPVNNDGTSWHTAHAFGDFCYICHAGNSQAVDKVEAHTGLVPPLSDINASCQQCHVSDLEERAEVFASALGVDISVSSPAEQNGASAEETTDTSTGIGLMVSTELDVNDPNVVDYVQRYNSLVLGEKTINLGNLIVVGLIGLVALGGGAFILHNEGWAGIDYQKVDQYPADLVEMLPTISKLSPKARKNLEQILKDPLHAEKLLSKIKISEEKE